MKVVIGVILILVFLGLAVSCEVYKYKDCKKVGHSTFYCVMKLNQ